MDGKNSTLTENDIQRRNTIALLLQDWNLIDVVNTTLVENKSIKSNKSVAFKEKRMEFGRKYNIGKKPEDSKNASQPFKNYLQESTGDKKFLRLLIITDGKDNAKEFHTADRLQEECKKLNYLLFI